MSMPITRRNLLQIAPLASVAASATIFQPGRAHAQTNQQSQVLSAGSFLPTSFQYGVGFNWYDVFGNDDRGNPTYPALDDAAGWRAVHEALDDLHPAIIRFGIPADDCVGQGTSQIRTDSVHFERLRRVADWAERSGCTILLDPFDIAKKFQFAPGPHDKGKWLEMAPRDNDAYAREFVAPLLQHVATKMNLRAVKLFNACNEPLQYGPFTTPENHPDAFVDYVDMYRAIQQALKGDGVYPDKIRLAGVDCIQPSRFPELDFIARGVDIDPYIDVYTIHYYFHRFDWMAPVPFLENSLEQSLDRSRPIPLKMPSAGEAEADAGECSAKE